MLDILLVNPNISRISDSGEGVLPPLGLCYVSAYLKQQGLRCEVLDANALDLGDQELLDAIKQKQPQLVGFTATTPMITEVGRLAALLKSEYPELLIIVGGPHVTVLPELTLKRYPGVDLVVRGEGEITTYELITHIKNQGRQDLSSLKGITYRDSQGQIISALPQPPLTDLDALPLPDRSDLPNHKYRPSIKWFNRVPFATIMTSRGCPNDCIFCASKLILGRAVRFRSPENVLKEIIELVETYGVKEIMFYDDTFTINKERISVLCDLIIAKGLDISWGCLSRVDRIDPELLKKMKQAGCHIMSYGVESGSAEMLKAIRKNISLEQVRLGIKATNEVGIDCSASFVFGVPGETVESMKKTIDFALEIDPLFAQFYRVVPFPGTDLFQLYLANHDINEINWDEFLEIGNTENLIKLDTISEDDFNRLLKESYRRFYLRPGKILQLAVKMASPYKLKGLLLAGISFIGIMFSKK